MRRDSPGLDGRLRSTRQEGPCWLSVCCLEDDIAARDGLRLRVDAVDPKATHRHVDDARPRLTKGGRLVSPDPEPTPAAMRSAIQGPAVRSALA